METCVGPNFGVIDGGRGARRSAGAMNEPERALYEEDIDGLAPTIISRGSPRARGAQRCGSRTNISDTADQSLAEQRVWSDRHPAGQCAACDGSARSYRTTLQRRLFAPPRINGEVISPCVLGFQITNCLIALWCVKTNQRSNQRGTLYWGFLIATAPAQRAGGHWWCFMGGPEHF